MKRPPSDDSRREIDQKHFAVRRENQITAPLQIAMGYAALVDTIDNPLYTTKYFGR
jgi:hypothetical protein